MFASKVSKKIKRSVGIVHINSIINLLCDYIAQSLEETGKFEVTNLGTFELTQMKPKSYFNVVEQKMKTTKGNKRIKFKLSKKLKKKIAKNIDLEKTIGEEDAETS